METALSTQTVGSHEATAPGQGFHELASTGNSRNSYSHGRKEGAVSYVLRSVGKTSLRKLLS